MTSPAGNGRAWYWMPPPEAARELGSDVSRGLTLQEARARLDKFGPNQLKEKEAVSPLTIFLEQFKDFIIWILVGAAIVSGILGEWVDAFAIIAIVILNAILGFVQEYRAEKSLAALKKLANPSTKVIRDGQLTSVPSAELVPGDLIELESGDNIPADARLVDTTPNFMTQEASLTGESSPVSKTALALEEKELPLADRANMVYMGTSVASAKARALVVTTGMDTELGKIAGMIQSIKREVTPLQRKLEQFGKWIVYLAFVLVAIVFLLEWLRGGEFIDVFLTAVSLAVAAIPEGLPAVVTIALALGVQRMVKRHALIRKLPSVETLGSATVICSDKTGTLTRNEMTVKVVYADGREFSVAGVGYEPSGEFRLAGKTIDPAAYPGLRRTLLCGVLCNGARLEALDNAYRVIGDPTEGALLTLGAKAGLDKQEQEEAHAFIEEIPFDSDRKKMTIVRRDGNRFVAYVKGAPDILLKDCSSIEQQGNARPMNEADRKSVLAENAALADQALRVLATAYRVFDREPSEFDAATIERDLTFAGLIAMMDPPREEVKDAIRECGKAGIRPVMITGDHKATAMAIARELGTFREGSLALSGEELDALSDDALFDLVERISVYARVSPEHKLRVVRAWRRHGEVVAMTGDGVNDAPALKEADIGVAMGITGTDVTKEVSDMIVTDDNFASIVAAIREGRGIYDNITKFIHYLLSCNAGEILVMFTASLLGLPLPLLPIHILWVNLVTDGFPALALGIDPVDPHIMERPPRSPRESIITKRRAVLILVQGGFIASATLAAFAYTLFAAYRDLDCARTIAFIVLATSQLFHSFNSRSQNISIFSIGFLTNKTLLLAATVSFLLQIMVVYVPFFQAVFKTVPLNAGDWVLVILVSSFPLWAMEAVKLVNRLLFKRSLV